MKSLIPSLVAVLCLPAFAGDEKPWPQKGAAVFVPGDLTGQVAVESSSGGRMEIVTVPACAPLWTFRAPKPDKVTVADATRGATFTLCGEWSEWIAPTLEACRAAAPITFQKVSAGCYAPVKG